MRTTLKSCPFCGGEAETICKPKTELRNSPTLYRIRCERCYAQSPYRANAYLHGWHETLKDADEAWNRRAEG